MPTRSFRWLVVTACLSVVMLVGATVFLAATSDETSGFAAELEDDSFEGDDVEGDDFEEDFGEDGTTSPTTPTTSTTMQGYATGEPPPGVDC